MGLRLYIWKKLIVLALMISMLSCTGAATTPPAELPADVFFNSFSVIPYTFGLVSEESESDIDGSAESGVSFGEVYTDYTSLFQDSDEIGHCLTSFSTKTAMSLAYEDGDRHICNFRAIADGSDADDAIFDGQDHVIEYDHGDFDFARVKINATETSPGSGEFNRFRMYHCVGNSLDSLVQNAYIEHSVDEDDNYTLISISLSPKTYSHHGKVTMTSKINASGQFVEDKVYNFIYDISKGVDGYELFGSGTMTQSQDNVYVEGFMAQQEPEEETLDTFRFSSLAQLIDRNNGSSLDMDKFAIGDGAAYFSRRGGETQNHCWNGDLSSLLSCPNDFLNSDLVTTNLPEASSSVSITFDEDQTWDCSGEAQSLMDAFQFTEDISEDIFACDTLNTIKPYQSFGCNNTE